MLELAALLESVTVARKLLTELAGLASDVKSGLFGRNEAIKKELADTLAKLEQSVRHVGQLASAARTYEKTHESVLDVLGSCRRMEAYLKDREAILRGHASSAQATAWAVLQAMFDTIAATRDAPIKVLYDRMSWYDVQDKAQLDMLFQNFAAAFERASIGVKNHYLDDVVSDLGQMRAQLQTAETLLRSTIDDKILATLQSLGT